MENTYNAKLSFKGEGSFTFTLPKYGELTVYNGKDVYVKGLTVSAVEVLRQLRPLRLEHQLNAKPDGCYKVLDLNTETNIPVKTFERAYKEPAKSVADLKAELVKSEGPIPTEEFKEDLANLEAEIKEETTEKDTAEKDASLEETKVEEPAKTQKTTTKKTTKKTTRRKK